MDEMVPRYLIRYELAEFMLANIHLFAPYDREEQHRIEAAWQQLKDSIRKCANN